MKVSINSIFNNHCLRLFGNFTCCCPCHTITGQTIDRNAMQSTAGGFQNGRWLVHDRYSFKLGKDTNCAWSAGCFILSSNDLARLNAILKNEGIKAGDEISGEVIEEE